MASALESSIHYGDVADSLYGSQYAYTRIQPWSQPVLSVSSSASCEFQLPPSQCWNPAKSLLQFDIVAPALASYCRFFHAGFNPFVESVSVSAGGKELLSCNELQYVSKLLLPCMTSVEKLNSNPPATPNAQNTAGVYQRHHVLYRTNSAGGNGDVYGARVETKVDGTDFDNTTVPYSGIANYVANATANQALAVRLSIPLGELVPGSILSLNKDLYTGEVWKLTVRFANSASFGYETKTNVDTLDADTKQFSTTPVISNVQVMCATVSDEVLASRIREKTMTEGVTFNMPQLWVERLSTTQTGSFIFQRRFSSAHGKAMIRAFVGVFNGASQTKGSNNFMNYNVGSVLYSSIRTQLDQRYLQPGALSINDGDHWMYLAPKLKGSAIQGNSELDQRCVFFDDWSPLRSCDWIDNLPKQQGLPLDTEKEYGVDLNLATANSQIVLVVQTQRPLRISREGSQFV